MNKLGRKKMIVYGLVLTGAMLGLLIDRLSRTGHDQTGAAPVPSAMLIRKPVPVAGTNAASVRGPALAAVFARSSASPDTQHAARSPVRNAFAMTDAMRGFFEEPSPEQKAAEEQKAQSEQEILRQQVAQFQAVHKLRGTTLNGAESCAIIDDRLVRLGETIDGFELKSVERYRATLVKGEAVIVLSLPVPGRLEGS